MDPADDPATEDKPLPVALLVLGTIDAMEYEALLEVEEAAAARREVFDAETDREAIRVLQDLPVDLAELDRARLETLSGLATARIDPSFFEGVED